MVEKSGKYKQSVTGKITRSLDIFINKELKKLQLEGNFHNIDLLLRDMMNCYIVVKKMQTDGGFNSVDRMLKELSDWYSLKPKTVN